MNRQTIRNVAGGVLIAFAVMLAGSFVSRAGAADGGCCGGMPDPKVLLRHTVHKL